MDGPERNQRVVLQHPELWNRSIYAALERKYETYRGTGNAQRLLSRCQELAPCVLLMDSNTALKCVEEQERAFLRAFGEEIAILVVDKCSATVETTKQFLYLGCRGVLNGEASPTIIEKAVAAVSEGEIWAPRQVVSSLLEKCLFQLGPNGLTQRERTSWN